MSAQAIHPHPLDYETDYCVRCGVSRLVIVDGRALPCVTMHGELAVQHLIAQRYMRDLFQTVFGDQS